MNQIYTAVIKQTDRWWIGWIEELPGVNCQETTREALLESLRVTLQEAIEFNRQEALQAAGDGFEETQVAVEAGGILEIPAQPRLWFTA